MGRCYEVLDIEGVLAWTAAEGAWERFTGPVGRLTRLIPEEVLVGYHLCYGTFPEWPMYEARDMGLLVRMANYAVANSGRTVDWLHLAGPRYLRSEDAGSSSRWTTWSPATPASSWASCCRSTGSRACGAAQATASRYLADFGVAMYCGFGRQPGKDGTETMREHARVVRSIQDAERR